jgi:hypothetical protein
MEPRQRRQKKVYLRHPYQLPPLLRFWDFQKLAGRQEDPAASPPLYSPNLAPADFLLFQKVKE